MLIGSQKIKRIWFTYGNVWSNAVKSIEIYKFFMHWIFFYVQLAASQWKIALKTISFLLDISFIK